MDNEQLLQAISDLIDKKFDEKFDEKFEKKINEELDKKIDEKLDAILDKKFDEKLKPIYNRLDILEVKQDRTIKKLDNLQLDFKIAERNINSDIHTLQDEMSTVIEVLKLNEMIPR